MLFVSYWELRNDQSFEERANAIQEQGLMELTDQLGIEILRWDVTPNNWGIIIFEADDVSAITEAFGIWQAKQPWFDEVKIAPAQPVEDSLESVLKTMERVS